MLAGIRMCRKVGEAVSSDETVAILYTSDASRLDDAEARLLTALRYSDEKPQIRKHIHGVIRGEDTERE